MKRIQLSALFFLLALSAFNQEASLSKKIVAQKSTGKIIIDADLSDAAWKEAPVITDFIEFQPTFGNKESYSNRTEIKILYDNNAIYVSGYIHETSIDSISKDLVGRDVIGANDFVGIIFDTYNDKINGFGYFVTSLGEQFDAKYSSNGEDPSWNSVYETNTKIVSDGWLFEMKIPYAAIRFSNKENQDWGINFTRKRNKSGIQLMWNPVNPAIGGGFLTQFGKWTDIKDIKPPVRLSLSPYFSVYANHYPKNQPGVKNTSATINGGVDIKYGINQAYTLDMTLVPDFGQVQSDNQVLNLTPFEVRFNENRTFFTEGTDLFGKGNLFYSRRIGGQPIHLYNVEQQLKPGESILKNPSETRLLNASKISGRSSSGLGIGFFNAVTKPQYASIEENSKETRRIETNPLTNYNILVFDQTLKNNSSISLINTNVTRSGHDYDANVTAALWDFYDKKNIWNFSGQLAASQLLGYLPAGKNLNGYSHELVFGKRSGRFNFNLFQRFADNKYNHNDLGYFTNNNFMDNGLWMSYRWLKPSKWYNRLNINFNTGLSVRYKPWDYQSIWMNTNINGQLKNLWFAGMNINFNPEQQDFYEPRYEGKVFKRPARYGMGFWVRTNSAKKYSASFEFFHNRALLYGSRFYETSVDNQFRFNKKLTISISTSLTFGNNNLGYATSFSSDSIIFALRQRRNVENTLTFKYNFTNKMGLSLRIRHYWSKVNNHSFFTLQKDGSLNAIPGGISRNVNNNVSFFNVDMVYTWQFALGSFINIVWKDAVESANRDISENYFKNLGKTLQSNQLNSLSLRIIYFLDYLSLKRK